MHPNVEKSKFKVAIYELILMVSLLSLSRPLIRGDALAYFAWTASIGDDFDLDLSNQASQLGSLNTYMAKQVATTGHYANAFAWGIGLLLQPSYQMARLSSKYGVLRINDKYFISLQGYPLPYSLFPMFQVILMVMISAWLFVRIAKAIGISLKVALFSGVLGVWGTPLYYYSTIEPLYVHASATFVHTLSIHLFLDNYMLISKGENTLWWVWYLAGLAFGFSALVRWQLLLSVIPIVLLLVYQRQWKATSLFAIGVVTIAWHIPYMFTQLFGSPFITPVNALEGQSNFVALANLKNTWLVLFSNLRGYFIWSPFALLGTIGLCLMCKYNRRLAFLFLGLLSCQILIASMVKDWSAGDSFGARRLTELYPVVTIGVAWWLQNSKGRMRKVVISATIVSVLYSLILLVTFLVFVYYTQPRISNIGGSVPQASALNILTSFIKRSQFTIVWPVIRDHGGPWEWFRPGP